MKTPDRQIVFDKKHHVIQIVAPSSSPKTLDGMHQVAQMLEDEGFKVIFSDDMLAQNQELWYANTLAKRTSDMHSALANKQVGIIWALRGGYGSSEVAHQLLHLQPNFLTFPKILIGFSDFTAMHSYIHNIYNIPSIHANNIASVAVNSHALSQIMQVLNGQDSIITLTPFNSYANDLTINAPLAGGNLAVLSCLVGTELPLSFDDKIVILEDVNEVGYQIMRYLMHLNYAGLFKKAKAIIFADFSNSDDYGYSALQHFAANCAIAVFKCSGIGHTSQNHALVLNYNCTITHNELKIFSPFQLIK